MSESRLKAALVLGLLTAIGPFAIDMYLPTLPLIGQTFNADTATVQASLMAFLLPFGLCQLIYGPISDMMGRKRPLYAGLVLFLCGSLICALTPNIEILLAGRFVQGLGACAAMVLPRAVVRDRFTGADAAKLMTLMMLVFSVAPIFAPTTGSLMLLLGEWRLVFWAMSTIAVLGLLLAIFALSETRGPEARMGAGPAAAMKAYGTLLRDWRFLALSLTGGFGISGFFVYIASAPFVIQQGYGLSPMQFSLLFSMNAIAFIGVSQMSSWLAIRFGMERVLRFAVFAYLVGAAVLSFLFLGGFGSLPILVALLFPTFGCIGLVMPLSSVLAMDRHGPIAGTASALMGTLHLVTGSAVMGIVTQIGQGDATSMTTGIACTGVGATAMVLLLGRPRRPQEAVVSH